MRKNRNKIHLNTMEDSSDFGITIDKQSFDKSNYKTAHQIEEVTHAHRDEGYTFHILEKGEVIIEIDFKTYHILAPAVVYLHPDKVHRMPAINNITVSSLSLKRENLNTSYLELLEKVNPAPPILLNSEAYIVISNIFEHCLSFYKQKNNILYYPLLRDCCNTLIGYLLSYFLNVTESENNPSRFENVTKAFRRLLEERYVTMKRPGQYAALLNISTSYLNDCIKGSTGYSVSYLIQERIILEAKRLLHHTDKSVKEIAFELGYDDYPYFSRLFSKVSGFSALTFRKKTRLV